MKAPPEALFKKHGYRRVISAPWQWLRRLRPDFGWVLAGVLGIGLLLPPVAFGACDDGVVQYKLAYRSLDKCPSFLEYTNLDLPRIHVYHQQVTHETYAQHSHTSGSNDTTVYTQYGWIGPGSWFNNHDEDRSVTHTELVFGPLCDYTNSWAGTWTLDHEDEDTRERYAVTDGGYGYVYTEYTYGFEDEDLGAQFVPSGPGWYWVGTDHTISKLVEFGADYGIPFSRNITNDDTRSVQLPIGITHSVSELTALTPTHKESVFSDDASTNTTTADLSQEYTDEELKNNILGLMPPYPADWSATAGSGYWSDAYAYSSIDASHRSGALQKMVYRFAVPDSEPDTTYKVTWDVITWYQTTGQRDVSRNTSFVRGTGNPFEPAYTSSQDAIPPWDNSPSGGTVIMWVSNVKITQVPKWDLVGGPGPLPPGGSPVGCDSCGGGLGQDNSWEGYAAEFSMGRTVMGASAGRLMTSAAVPSTGLFSPAALSYAAASPDVEVISVPGQIRQVNAPQALADIVTLDAFAYEVRFYLPGQVGALVNGVHEVSGSPFVSWKIQNPDASTNTYNRVRVTETRGGSVKAYDYVHTASTGSWKLGYPGGVREDDSAVVVVTNQTGGYTRTVTTTVRRPGGADQQRLQRAYQAFDWGEALTQETAGTGAAAKTTTYVYNPNTYANRLGQPLQKIINPDGSWQWFVYDSLGRYAQVYSSRGDVSPDGEQPPANARRTDYSYDPALVSDPGGEDTLHPDIPRAVYEYDGSDNVANHYTAFPSADLRIDVQTTAPYIWDPFDSSSLFTTNRYYTNGPNALRLKSIVRPDRTLQTFDYADSPAGDYRTNMTAAGKPDAAFTRVTDGTTNLSVINLAGYPVLSLTRDVATGVILSQDTYSNFDSFGRPQRVTHLDGTHEDTYYSCCDVDSTIDRDGVTAQYWYDPMKRRTATTRLGITLTNVLDAAGRVLATVRVGSDASPITQSRFQYDLAGTLIAQTNALGGRTGVAETTNSSGGLVRTTTYPDTGTRVETYYRDGTLQSVTGTAVHGVRYQYGVDNAVAHPNGPLRYTLETKLNANGSDSSEWTRTYIDAAGRVYKTLYADDTPGSLSDNPYSQRWYNNYGQLWKERDPDDVITLHTFNDKGELEYTITAIESTTRAIGGYQSLLNSLSTIKTGADRITRTVRSVVTGTPARFRTETYVWKDGESTGTLVSRADTSVDGLQSWQTAYPNPSTAVTSHSQTAYGANRAVTRTAPDNSYSIEVYTSGRLASATRYDSSAAQIGLATYGHDSHGRRSTVTDARNGTTSYGYNAADLVTTLTTPNPGTPGGAPQTTTTTYNNMLQVTGVLNADGTTLASEYYLTGELKRQYGSRTYPVGYSYEYAGRLQTMTNWSGFPSTGARVTTWNYNPYRGWLANKRYPDKDTGLPGSIGLDYTYTAAGRLHPRTWARGITTTYGHNNAGDLETVAYDDGTTANLTYGHDRQGRRSSVTQGGNTAALAYNDSSQLLSEANSAGTLAGLSVTNGYDGYLRRASLSARNAGTALAHHSFGYDSASRLQTVTDDTGATAYSATYAYAPNSALISQVVFKQAGTTRLTTTKQHDYLNRLTQIQSAPSASSAVGSSYVYNNANQRVRSTLADGSYWLYEYDSLGQVRSGRKYWANQTPVAGQQFEYGFDDIGNRTFTKAGGDENGVNLRYAGYTPNRLNQYTSRDVPGAVDVMGLSFATNTVTVNSQAAYRKGEYFRKEVSLSNGSTPVWQAITVAATGQSAVTGNAFVPKTQEIFYHDADGNLTNDGRWTYTWDAENRLVKLTPNTAVGPQISLKFEYDWQSRRIRKQVWPNTNWSGTPTNDVKFLYEGWNLLTELNATNNAVIRSYVWGSDLSGTIQGAGGVGGLLFIGNGASAIGYSAAAFDGNGNVMALVSLSGGTNCATYEYSPFGELLRATGPMAKANPFRFSTKYQDDETDLLYYSFRYYGPSTGRWLSRDPLEEEIGGENLYAFVYNNPVDYLDQLGLCVSCASSLSAAAAPPPMAPHQCQSGKLKFKRKSPKKYSSVADIQKKCNNAPACSTAPYRDSMKCKECGTCNSWRIVLNITADCEIYYLDDKKVTTFQYVPNAAGAIKHEQCHCDDWEAAYQAIINQVGSVTYSTKSDCEKAKANINLQNQISQQIAPSMSHVDSKWQGPSGACYGEWTGKL